MSRPYQPLQQPVQTHSSPKRSVGRVHATDPWLLQHHDMDQSPFVRRGGQVGISIRMTPAGPSDAAGMLGGGRGAASRRPARDAAQAPLRKLSVSLIDTYKTINQVRRRAGGRLLLSVAPAALAQWFDHAAY